MKKKLLEYILEYNTIKLTNEYWAISNIDNYFEISDFNLIKLLFEYGVKYDDIQIESNYQIRYIRELDLYISDEIKNKSPIQITTKSNNRQALIYLFKNNNYLDINTYFKMKENFEINPNTDKILKDYFLPWRPYTNYLYSNNFIKMVYTILLIQDNLDNNNKLALPPELIFIVFYFCNRTDFD